MPRYNKLGYVALGVSNVERSVDFYENVVGLERVGKGARGEIFFRCSGDHHNLILYQGPIGLRRIGWQMESDGDVEGIAASAGAAGLQVVEVPADESSALEQGRTIRVIEPNSMAVFEFYSRIAQEATPFAPTLAKIERLGHVVLRTPKPAESTAVALDVFNFRCSDTIAGLANFLRCFPNPFHHSLAFVRSKDGTAGLNHVNFMVSEIDDIGRALTRLKGRDVPIVFGPGRHPPSESIFLYFLDPDGMTVEYSLGMETFQETGARGPRTLPATRDSFDYWNNVPDPRMGTTGAILPA